jgi:hypothetical protein
MADNLFVVLLVSRCEHRQMPSFSVETLNVDEKTDVVSIVSQGNEFEQRRAKSRFEMGFKSYKQILNTVNKLHQ